MKKVIASITAAVCALSMSASAAVMEFKMNDTNLKVQSDDGIITDLTLDAAPFTVNDRTVVPVRVISENFGANVEYNESDETVTVTKGDTVITLAMGKNTAYVNDKEVVLDVEPFTKNGRTMVPVRFISEYLGYNVEYNEYLGSVTITDEELAMTVNGIDISRAEYKMLYDEALSSGIYTTPESVRSAIEPLLKEICVLYANRPMNDNARALLDNLYNYEYYKSQVNALESTYAQLMTKNVIASDYYSTIYNVSETGIDDSTVQEYYEQNYVTAKHILIPTIDLDTYKDLSEDEKEEAKELADELYSRIQDGEDFDTLMNEYSKDTGLAYYPDGYTFTYGEMVQEFEDTAFSLEEGAVSEPVKSPYGYHIIKKEPLEPLSDSAKLTIKSTIAESIAAQITQAEIDSAQVTLNEEVIKSITEQ